MKKKDNNKEMKKISSEKKSEILNIVLIELSILLFLSVSLKNIIGAIGFIFSYFIVFFIPGLPLCLILKDKNILEKLILVNGYSLILLPCLYFLIGLVITPVSWTLFFIIPIFVSAMTFAAIKKIKT